MLLQTNLLGYECAWPKGLHSLTQSLRLSAKASDANLAHMSGDNLLRFGGKDLLCLAYFKLWRGMFLLVKS